MTGLQPFGVCTMANGYAKFTAMLASIEEEELVREEEQGRPTCRVCLAEAKRPVQLSCGHIFCWHCIVIDTISVEGQACPRCGKPHNTTPEVIYDCSSPAISTCRLHASYRSADASSWALLFSCTHVYPFGSSRAAVTS